jgi:hypothetical protein
MNSCPTRWASVIRASTVRAGDVGTAVGPEDPVERVNATAAPTASSATTAVATSVRRSDLGNA